MPFTYARFIPISKGTCENLAMNFNIFSSVDLAQGYNQKKKVRHLHRSEKDVKLSNYVVDLFFPLVLSFFCIMFLKFYYLEPIHLELLELLDLMLLLSI